MSETARLDLARFGLAVGHATDDAGATGLTVVRGIDGPLRAGVAVFGRATGTRELHTASAAHRVAGRVDAILLTGGSGYGLDAAAGVMRWMEERGRGFAVGPVVVPIVPAAVVFDLLPLGRPDARPTPAMAHAAAESARSYDIAEGSVGAGTGVTVGKALGPQRAMKGGVGAAVAESADGAFAAAALAVVNAVGDVRDGNGAIIAGARDGAGRFLDVEATLRRGARPDALAAAEVAPSTTLAVVASSVPMSTQALTQLARASGAALFRRITPAGSSADGDIVFAVSPFAGRAPAMEAMAMETAAIEALAVAALEHAIERAVRLARGRDGIPGLADHVG